MPRKPRVIIPSDPTEAISLLKFIKEKHDADAAASPLASLDWGKIGPALTNAALHDAAADKAKRDMEREFGARDVDMPVVEQAVRSVRDILLGLFADNPKKLGDWHLEVHESPAPQPPTTAPAVKSAT
jgi:hypothetical protein